MEEVRSSSLLRSTKYLMKTLLVPGWMKSVNFYGDFSGIDLWNKRFVAGDYRSAECVVAHSMGAAYALADENIGNEKTKYLLVNPLIVKRNIFSWFWRWLKCAFRKDMRFDPALSFFGNLSAALRRATDVSAMDIETAIEKIGKDNIVILRGERDNYFFDREAAEIASRKGIRVVEVEGAGHEWSEKFVSVLASFLV